MTNSTGILYEGGGETSPAKNKRREVKPRIDLEFERMIVACGIGCIVNDIDLSDTDYVRLYLAFSRLSKKHE